MKLTALSIALIAALGMAAGCSTQSTPSQAARPAVQADAHAQYALGRYYQGQQRYDLAIEAYRKALAANPAHVGAHNGLGACLLLAGRSAEAIEQFKAGLQHQPASAALWNNLGYAYALSGENTLAELAYRQSLSLDPTDFRTNTNLAEVRQRAPAAAPAMTAQTPPAQAQLQAIQAAPAEVKSIPLYAAAPQAAAESKPAQAMPEPAMPEPAVADRVLPQSIAVHARVTTVEATPAAAAQTAPAEPAPAAAATPAVQVVQLAPRLYEMNLRDTNAVSATRTAPAPVAGAGRLSVSLRDAAIRMAAVDTGFVLEIRNGNGVRHMALRTSRYLADYGYSTKRLTNQPGFNVRVTRIFYLPGYMEQATQLLAHLPGDTVLTETSGLRRGIHVRIVLGKDMAQHQASLDAAQAKVHLAALQP